VIVTEVAKTAFCPGPGKRKFSRPFESSFIFGANAKDVSSEATKALMTAASLAFDWGFSPARAAFSRVVGRVDVSSIFFQTGRTKAKISSARATKALSRPAHNPPATDSPRRKYNASASHFISAPAQAHPATKRKGNALAPVERLAEAWGRFTTGEITFAADAGRADSSRNSHFGIGRVRLPPNPLRFSRFSFDSEENIRVRRSLTLPK